jgi:hypothetical protein
MESFGYTLLQIPLESLIISYPHEGLKSEVDKIQKEKEREKEPNQFDKDFVKATIVSNKDDGEQADEDKPGYVEESEAVSELEENESKTVQMKMIQREK